MIDSYKRITQVNDNRRKSTDKRMDARPDGRATNNQNSRMTWQRKHEHFTALARSASVAGNGVDAENFYQHAEHYFRMMQDAAARS